MRTQSIDTHPEAERVQIGIMRAFAPARKFRAIANLTDTLAKSGLAYRESSVKRIAVQYDITWARRFATYTRTHPNVPIGAPDLCAALLSTIREFERRNIPFALSGRLACGVYGLPSTVDVLEFIVDYPRHLFLSVAHTRMEDSYLDITRLVRVDIQRSAALSQTQLLTLVEGHAPIPVIAPEAIALALLRKFDVTGRRDDALYNDLLGLLKVQAPNLDITAMLQWTELHDLVMLAFDDAGIAA